MDLVTLIQMGGYTCGAEIGVWRGRTSFQILDQCPAVHFLALIDPWRWEKNHFQVTQDTVLPARMPPGWYHSFMGEQITNQDAMEQIYQGVQARVARDYAHRARVHRMPSTMAAGMFPLHTLDFVYIDAIHLYEDVLNDLISWWGRVRPGGLVSGDDWGSEFPGVERAVRDFMEGDHVSIQHEGPLWWVNKPTKV